MFLERNCVRQTGAQALVNDRRHSRVIHARSMQRSSMKPRGESLMRIGASWKIRLASLCSVAHSSVHSCPVSFFSVQPSPPILSDTACLCSISSCAISSSFLSFSFFPRSRLVIFFKGKKETGEGKFDFGRYYLRVIANNLKIIYIWVCFLTRLRKYWLLICRTSFHFQNKFLRFDLFDNKILQINCYVTFFFFYIRDMHLFVSFLKRNP